MITKSFAIAALHAALVLGMATDALFQTPIIRRRGPGAGRS
jgi:hypothetical protein